MTRRNKIILLLILLALECVLLFWCRNRYMTVLSSGTVYESPASVDFKPVSLFSMSTSLPLTRIFAMR